MALEKRDILKTIEICKLIEEEIPGNKSTQTNTTDKGLKQKVEENKQKYRKVIKPQIDNRFNKNTPGKKLKNFLKDKILPLLPANGYSVPRAKSWWSSYKITPYIWSCIKNNKNQKKSSQLYVLISSSGIRYGFCYGNDISSDDPMVERVRDSNKNLKKRIKKILEDSNDIELYLDKEGDWIKTDELDNWNNKYLLLVVVKKDDISDQIANEIRETLKTLLPIYKDITKEDYSKKVNKIGRKKMGGEKRNVNIGGVHANRKEEDKHPKNIILCGPPGTGKTYHVIDYALSIIQGKRYEAMIKKDRCRRIEEFNNKAKEGLIKFITFHQSYSYEEFIEGLKAKTNRDTNEIEYFYEDGIFKRLCIKSLLEYIKKIKGLDKDIEEEETFQEIKKKFMEEHPIGNVLKTLKRRSEFKIDNYLTNSIRIEVGNGDNVYSISHHYLKDVMFKNESKEIFPDGLRSYYEPILNEMRKIKKELAQKTLDDIEEMDYHSIKNIIINNLENINKSYQATNKYVIIIDEINRGNVSKIFGELISLIEKDKRLASENQLITTLPYSKERFGVPPNLYIIGTMNTADRSIAMMDTALRRRFTFKEMMPDYGVLNDLLEVGEEKNVSEWDLSEIDISQSKDIKKLAIKSLWFINQKIKWLYDRDHQIGHSYLIGLKDIKDKKQLENKLRFIFKYKIIPLLQEYFHDDWEKIYEILGKEFIEKETKSPIEKEILTPDSVYEIKDFNVIRGLKSICGYEITSEDQGTDNLVTEE